MEYTERYKQFLRLGGGKNHEYQFFIQKMVKEYKESGMNGKHESIIDHDLFTSFIQGWVYAEINNAEGKISFGIRFKNENSYKKN